MFILKEYWWKWEQNQNGFSLLNQTCYTSYSHGISGLLPLNLNGDSFGGIGSYLKDGVVEKSLKNGLSKGYTKSIWSWKRTTG